MRKLLYSVFFGLILCLGIYSYNSFNTKEVSILNNDILNDYEDIIIKRGNENQKLIALTFDDGPDEASRPQVRYGMPSQRKAFLGHQRLR